MRKIKDDIIYWLQCNYIENYTVNDDLTVDVKGDVHLTGKTLGEIPIQFGVINGTFYCGANSLTSLKGSPHTVVGNFNCGNNLLTSLEYSPNSIGGSFTFYDNKLINLDYLPLFIGGSISCCNNPIESIQKNRNNLNHVQGNFVHDYDLETGQPIIELQQYYVDKNFREMKVCLSRAELKAILDSNHLCDTLASESKPAKNKNKI